MAEDKWARWLKEERWPDQPAALKAALDSVRDKVLALAEVQPGESVIDLGAGTGLLGLKAAETVGSDGTVIFFDVSADALREAVPQAHVGCERFLVGDALTCPIRDSWANAVVIRSVLIYMPDKLAAARELARILKAGGRAAIYEPINRRMQHVVDMSAFDDVAAAYRSAMDMSPLTNFDEHTLATDFREAGFASVEIEMGETRMPVNGKGWAHGFKHGAPRGYSGYDMLLAGGVSRERADEFVAAGERQLGDRWAVMACPAMYMLAVR